MPTRETYGELLRAIDREAVEVGSNFVEEIEAQGVEVYAISDDPGLAGNRKCLIVSDTVIGGSDPIAARCDVFTNPSALANSLMDMTNREYETYFSGGISELEARVARERSYLGICNLLGIVVVTEHAEPSHMTAARAVSDELEPAAILNLELDTNTLYAAWRKIVEQFSAIGYMPDEFANYTADDPPSLAVDLRTSSDEPLIPIDQPNGTPERPWPNL